MRRGIVLVSLAVLGGLLSGCGITGEWTLVTVEPKEAARHYAFGEFELRPDGTYEAEADFGKGLTKSSGTYTYENGKLTLVAADGETRTYDARLIEMASKLEVVSTMQDGKKVTAVMRRD